ncbi:MAG: ATP-binding protein [Acidobacteriia bacterium]|jgi:AAA15 family ATPase/GTPase|nr:ATP-binding protein [Terriglobia bacterium]
MIVSFSVSNFRSFQSEETFSLVASNRLAGSHEDHAIPIPGSKERVLRTAVLYGANGAGKSNLFKALRYLRSAALKARERNSGTGREAFRFGGVDGELSSFDLQFIAGEKLFRFGLKLNDQRITEEWLLEIDGSREKTLYERITDEHGKVTIDAQGIKNAGEKLRALATVGGPQNQSFLATIYATLEAPDYGEELNAILEWFNSGLNLIAPTASFRTLGDLLARDSHFKEFADDFLRLSSTGVDHLKISKAEIAEDDLRTFLPADTFSSVLKSIAESDDDMAIVRLSEGNELLIERSEEKHFYLITIQAAHQDLAGKEITLELADESDGTRRLLNLMPALHHMKTSGAVYLIDEIDRSLHPILVVNFLQLFLKSCKGRLGQVIVTTHESNLLDLELLRRDEIWFAEKDSGAATRLYSLADFKVRKDLEIRKHYLQGRFGAVPFMGDINRLLLEKGNANEPCTA